MKTTLKKLVEKYINEKDWSGLAKAHSDEMNAWHAQEWREFVEYIRSDERGKILRKYPKMEEKDWQPKNQLPSERINELYLQNSSGFEPVASMLNAVIKYLNEQYTKDNEPQT
jgi:hypothetical protein